MADLCGLKPHVLRYWEQEFTQLRPMKRRGNRRYYQHHEVLMIRRIRELLYDQGFTINGARSKLQEIAQHDRDRASSDDGYDAQDAASSDFADSAAFDGLQLMPEQVREVERELKEIRDLLTDA